LFNWRKDKQIIELNVIEVSFLIELSFSNKNDYFDFSAASLIGVVTSFTLGIETASFCFFEKIKDTVDSPFKRPKN